MIDKIKIGEFLRQLRKESGLTQEELAEKFAVSSRSVSRWENGSTMPELGILVELADFYKIDIKELIDGKRKRETMNEKTKEVLKAVVDYAEQEKKLTVRRKCIVTLVSALFFALCIFLGAVLLPKIPDTIENNIKRIFAVIGGAGVLGLWSIVIYQNRKNKEKEES